MTANAPGTPGAPPTVTEALTRYLEAATAEKVDARSRTTSWVDRLRLGSVWAVLVAVIGAWWTVHTYNDQRQRELAAERTRTIATFASELSDPARRNGAAYALAILAGPDALPLLMEHLKGTDDPGFRTAIGQSMIAIGTTGFDEMARLNRERTRDEVRRDDPILLATQPVLHHFVLNASDALRGDGPPLDGVVLLNVPLSGRSLDEINLTGARVLGATACGASLRNAHLERTRWVDVHVMVSNFEGADLQGATFSGAGSLAGSTFARANLAGVEFGPDIIVRGVNVDGARNLTDAQRAQFCRGRARNVPGGCAGYEPSPEEDSGSTGSCW